MKNTLGSGMSVTGSNAYAYVRFGGAAAFFAAASLAAFMLPATFPVRSFADTLSQPVWGAGSDTITITGGGTYHVPFKTSEPISLSNPNYTVFGDLYYLPEGPDVVYDTYETNDSPTREYIATIGTTMGWAATTTDFAWEKSGTYEIDVEVPDYARVSDTLLERLGHMLFGEKAEAMMLAPYWKLETIRFTIQEADTQPKESSVLFIPGVEGSRLYQQTLLGENQRWEPRILSTQTDAYALYLHPDGTSINTIYTKPDATIDRVGVAIDETDIYGPFLAQLAGLKASSTIADYLAFPYDWRMSPESVVSDGTLYADGTHYIDQALIALAARSKTGKVTIVAHSNGGLVAKALITKLQSEGKANLVDKLILVDVPQLGTPQTVAAMLHGDGESLDAPYLPGFIVSQATARGLSEYMPDAYDLLPSAMYFARVASPVVDVSKTPDLRSPGLSSSTIASASDLALFLTGGRAKPAARDIDSPDVLSSSLLSSATALHQDLDVWTPPAGIQVIQIAGWGLDTVSGISYNEVQEATCLGSLCKIATSTRHAPIFTDEGDDTVVIPSQAASAAWPTYYLNLDQYRFYIHQAYDHKNITAMPTFQNLFSLLLSSSSPQTLPQYVSTTEPPSALSDNELRLRVLSPVTLNVYDSAGRHTGMAPNPNGSTDPDDDLYVQEQIPGSTYMRFGEGQYVSVPGEGSYMVRLHGTDSGTFTFEVTPVAGGVAGTPITFSGIPVTASSSATIILDSAHIASTAVSVDENGDGKIDITIASSSEVSDPLAYTKFVGKTVLSMDIGILTKIQLEAKFANVAFLIMRDSRWDAGDGDARDISHDPYKTRINRKLALIETYLNAMLARSASGHAPLEHLTPAQATQIFGMIQTLQGLINSS